MDQHYELPLVILCYKAHDRQSSHEPQRCVVAYDAEGFVVHVVDWELGASGKGARMNCSPTWTWAGRMSSTSATWTCARVSTGG